MEFQQVSLICGVAYKERGSVVQDFSKKIYIEVQGNSEDKVRLHVRLHIGEISFVLCLRHFAAGINCCIPD